MSGFAKGCGYVSETSKGKWRALISLFNDCGRTIDLINAEPEHYRSGVAAVRTVLEVINGLGLVSVHSETFPVGKLDGETIQEKIPPEFINALRPLKFDSGRFFVGVNPQGLVRLQGGFVDSQQDKAFVWLLSPDNKIHPKNAVEAVTLGVDLLAALGLTDMDHGHHTIQTRDGVTLLNDCGETVRKQ